MNQDVNDLFVKTTMLYKESWKKKNLIKLILAAVKQYFFAYLQSLLDQSYSAFYALENSIVNG